MTCSRLRARVLVAAVSFILSACEFQILAPPAPELAKSQTAPLISQLSVANSVFTISGSNLSEVTSVRIEGGSVSQTLSIQSKAAGQIQAVASSALTLAAGTVYNLIVANAHAASFPVTFEVQDGTVTPAKLDRSYVEAAGDSMTGTLDVSVSSGNAATFVGGNVGIGTSMPLSSFHVSSGSVTLNTGVNINTNEGGLIRRLLGTASDGGGNWTINYGEATERILAHRWYTNVGNVMSITKPGNVGIGTGSPAQRLSVAGTRPVASFKDTSSTRSGYVGQFGLDALHMTSNLTHDGTNWNRDDTAAGGGVLLLNDGDLTYRNVGSGANPASLTERFRIDSNGNVGIGTASPAAKLHISHSVTDIPHLMGIFAGINTEHVHSTTSNRYSFSYGNYFSIKPNISSGVTESGFVTGLYSSTTRSEASDTGSLATMTGAFVTYGHQGTTARSTTTAYGVHIKPNHAGGTISSSYGLFIDSPSTGGTVTNPWGVYQAHSGTNNYLAGAVRIGGSGTPADKLDVVGDIRVGVSGTDGCLKDASGGMIVGTCSSDIRLKKDIQPLSSMLERVAALQPVTYKWRADEFPERKLGDQTQWGLIAQDAEEMLPEIVEEKGDGYKAVAYHRLPVLLIQAVKELYAKVTASDDEHSREIAQLKRESEKKDRKIAELESRLERLEGLLKK